ncbi:hypothetical protein [Neobacillus massiliamazoniensis]|uniref:Uncharacterized protein n=1 Tax=Neobacillus massiliamazoniensis TaxID=1499688 RepID=A0A0U1NZK0_9BACI|nr:hypothetical protein [Neobacillus massiliamazoniensis]CRK83417.1 hypothetical protein BN000_03385 [Neobacillus massiliamazoniensis]
MEWYRYLALVGLIFWVTGVLNIYFVKKQIKNFKNVHSLPDDFLKNKNKRLLLASFFVLLGILLSFIATMFSY